MSNARLAELNKITDAATGKLHKFLQSVLDPQSLVETDKYVQGDTALGVAPGEGVVCGFATVDGVRVGIFATNPAVLKGSIGKVGAHKIAKVIASATASGLPVVGVLDTAGARFSEETDAMEGYAAVFRALSDAYGTVPTALLVKGVNFGLSSYFCRVCDLCIGFKDAQIASSSPLILAADTKEDPAKVCQSGALAKQSGLVTNVVSDEKEAKAVLSSFLGLLHAPIAQTTDDPNRTAKSAPKTPTAFCTEIFDKNTLLQLRADYAPEVLTAFARLDGVTVGVVGVAGKLTAAGASKISELLNTCAAFDLPVVNAVDCEGAQTDLNSDGLTVREIADMMYAYSQVDVPKITLVCGNAIGLGYTAFAARSIVDYVIACADAKIGTVSGQAAAQLLYKEQIAAATDKEKAAAKLAAVYADEHLSASVVAQKGYLDNVIEPTLARPYLIAALQTLVG